MKSTLLMKIAHFMIFTVSLIITWLIFDLILDVIRGWVFVKDEPSSSYLGMLALFISELIACIFVITKYKAWKVLLMNREKFGQLGNGSLIFSGALIGFSLAFIYSILTELFFLITFRYII